MEAYLRRILKVYPDLACHSYENGRPNYWVVPGKSIIQCWIVWFQMLNQNPHRGYLVVLHPNQARDGKTVAASHTISHKHQIEHDVHPKLIPHMSMMLIFELVCLLSLWEKHRISNTNYLNSNGGWAADHINHATHIIRLEEGWGWDCWCCCNGVSFIHRYFLSSDIYYVCLCLSLHLERHGSIILNCTSISNPFSFLIYLTWHIKYSFILQTLLWNSPAK